MTIDAQLSIAANARTIAFNGAGGRAGFDINAFRAGPLMRSVPAVKTCNTLHIKHLSARMLGLVYWFTRAEGPA